MNFAISSFDFLSSSFFILPNFLEAYLYWSLCLSGFNFHIILMYNFTLILHFICFFFCILRSIGILIRIPSPRTHTYALSIVLLISMMIIREAAVKKIDWFERKDSFWRIKMSEAELFEWLDELQPQHRSDTIIAIVHWFLTRKNDFLCLGIGHEVINSVCPFFLVYFYIIGSAN